MVWPSFARWRANGPRLRRIKVDLDYRYLLIGGAFAIKRMIDAPGDRRLDTFVHVCFGSLADVCTDIA